MEKFNKELYNDEFFEWHNRHVHEMEVECGEILSKAYGLKTLVDFGCGIGSFLLGAKLQRTKVNGYEIGGDYARKYAHKMVVDYIDFNSDVTKPIKPLRKYDLAMCVEVAEHIETQYSKQLVENIADSSDMCVWTSAPPGQDGCGHINLQTIDYWIKIFNDNGMLYDPKETTELLKLWEGIAPDYVFKNLMVFKK